MKVIQNAAQFLHGTGLLAEINRVVLNPRGLALSIIAEMPGPDPFEERRAAGFGPLYDKRDDEGVVFADGDLARAAAQLRAREEDGTVPVRPLRRARLGFIVQPAPRSPAPQATPRERTGVAARRTPGENQSGTSTKPPSSKPPLSRAAVAAPPRPTSRPRRSRR
jgi:hypothetical protein